MVELAMGWLDELKKREGTEKWLELVETLRTVTEGKVGIHFMYSNYYMQDSRTLRRSSGYKNRKSCVRKLLVCMSN